ncbi:MAG: hypothetical protein AAF939_05425 [Planctomycetota bacterium]
MKLLMVLFCLVPLAHTAQGQEKDVEDQKELEELTLADKELLAELELERKQILKLEQQIKESRAKENAIKAQRESLLAARQKAEKKRALAVEKLAEARETLYAQRAVEMEKAQAVRRAAEKERDLAARLKFRKIEDFASGNRDASDRKKDRKDSGDFAGELNALLELDLEVDEQQMEAIEQWAEKYAESWEKWAQKFEGRMDQWAKLQEVEWEKWAEDYSKGWESWAEKLEAGSFSEAEIEKLLKKNLKMLEKMPLDTMLNDLMKEGMDDLEEALPQVGDLQELVGSAIEKSLESVELSKIPFNEMEVESESLKKALNLLQQSLDQTGAQRNKGSEKKMQALDKLMGMKLDWDANEGGKWNSQMRELKDLKLIAEQLQLSKQAQAEAFAQAQAIANAQSGKDASKAIRDAYESLKKTKDGLGKERSELAKMRLEIEALRKDVERLRKEKSEKREERKW